MGRALEQTEAAASQGSLLGWADLALMGSLLMFAGRALAIVPSFQGLGLGHRVPARLDKRSREA